MSFVHDDGWPHHPHLLTKGEQEGTRHTTRLSCSFPSPHSSFEGSKRSLVSEMQNTKTRPEDQSIHPRADSHVGLRCLGDESIPQILGIAYLGVGFQGCGEGVVSVNMKWSSWNSRMPVRRLWAFKAGRRALTIMQRRIDGLTGPWMSITTGRTDDDREDGTVWLQQ